MTTTTNDPSSRQLPLWMPDHENLPAKELPEPYQSLLAHDQDMTSTLSRHHGQAIRLRVLEKIQRQESLERRVVLVAEDSRQPVEYGAIRIELAPFPEDAKKQILDCEIPLGTILSNCHIAYTSHPQGFFRLISTPEMDRALDLVNPKARLFGRRNRLLDAAGQTLAEVVEILPPEKPRQTESDNPL